MSAVAAARCGSPRCKHSAASGRPEALPRLARFFRERWVPFGSRAERRAAYESLQGYPPDVRAWLVMRGLRSRDQEIRAVCERLRSAG